MKLLILIVATASQCIRSHICLALASPRITKHSLAGLWKLTGLSSNVPSIDETETDTSPDEQQYYLKLNDDGSFQAMHGGTMVSAGSLLAKLGVKQGMWEYRKEDGQLILAADRSHRDDNDNGNDNNSIGQDTIFEGKVECRQTDAIYENESILMVEGEEELVQNQTMLSTQEQNTEIWFSVPRGWVRIGKFFYPKDHPSFFDTPMFHPNDVGTFQLHQVLSNHPPQLHERQDGNRFVEKFRREDFTKTSFWLSSYPIPDPKPKGRWSIKYGQYVQDIKEKKSTTTKKDEDPRNTRTTNDFPSIRVLKIDFYANYTFLVTHGVGMDFQLRGKWDIWGEERDVFWMQISRFGFGRQVSGSTYSQGQHLSHEDCKWYRGEIHRNEEDGGEIQVKGEVYLGKGTPFREALFVLREAHEDRADGEEEDEDDDDKDEDAPDSPSTSNWSTNAFQ